jgi:hypothetical protein
VRAGADQWKGNLGNSWILKDDRKCEQQRYLIFEQLYMRVFAVLYLLRLIIVAAL